MQSLLILGRQPDLSLAELESLYGGSKIRTVGRNAAIIDVDPCLLAFDRLGGSIKFARVLSEIDSVDWNKINAFLLEVSPAHSERMPAGKMYLGISAYGFNVKAEEVTKAALRLKQVVRKTGRSVKVVPNVQPELSSAQIIHNRLTTTNGWELLLIRDGQKTVIAQTVKVQDIGAYTRRDRTRPERDPKAGMLPPKLAQIIVNLASGELPEESKQSVCEIPPDEPIPKTYFDGSLLLDPFCGTGVIVQEAAIMGYNCTGTDFSEEMVERAKANLEWLKNLPRSPLSTEVNISLNVADARDFHWEKPSFVASELYLGRALSQADLKIIASEKKDCNELLYKFLKNISGQIDSGTRLCLAVPAWQISANRFERLPVLDSLGVIGYNRVEFRHARNPLIYYRPNQIVARELLTITRK